MPINQPKDHTKFFKDVFNRALSGDVKLVEGNDFFDSLEYPISEHDFYDTFLEVGTKMVDEHNDFSFKLSVEEDIAGEGGPAYQYIVVKVEILESNNIHVKSGEIFYFNMPVDFDSWVGVDCSCMIQRCYQVYRAKVTRTDFVSKDMLNKDNVIAIL